MGTRTGARTWLVILSFSIEMKLLFSSKCISPNVLFLIMRWLSLPLTSIMRSSIWLLDRPGKRILPVYSSYSVQPMDQMSIAVSYGRPRTESVS